MLVKLQLLVISRRNTVFGMLYLQILPFFCTCIILLKKCKACFSGNALLSSITTTTTTIKSQQHTTNTINNSNNNRRNILSSLYFIKKSSVFNEDK